MENWLAVIVYSTQGGLAGIKFVDELSSKIYRAVLFRETDNDYIWLDKIVISKDSTQLSILLSGALQGS